MFGERQSQFSVAGYVPSINPDGIVRVGQGQIKAASIVQDREIKKDEQRVSIRNPFSTGKTSIMKRSLVHYPALFVTMPFQKFNKRKLVSVILLVVYTLIIPTELPGKRSNLFRRRRRYPTRETPAVRDE